MIENVRRFVREEIIPHETEWINGSFHAQAKVFASIRAKVKAAGLWVPDLKLPFAEFVGLSEELGYSPFGHYLFGCNAPDAGNMELLAESGSDEQKKRCLAPLHRGEIRSCFGMTEKGSAGSNPLLLRTRARKDGDAYVIDGEKWFTTGADGAAFCIVMAVTDETAPPYRRASMFLVDLPTAGVNLRRNIPVMGHVGEGPFGHCELTFESVRVPASSLLGAEGDGFVLAQRRLGPGRLHHASRWIGLARRALDMMCERAVAREIGDGERLAEKQIVQAWVAESAAELAAARAMVREVAVQVDTAGSKEAQLGIAMIKYYVAGVLQRGIDRAIQAHGAYGLTDDCLLSHLYRQERAARIYDGPDEVHKVSVGAKVLKRFAEA